MGHGKPIRPSGLLGWWYACIAVGFFLLALVQTLRGAGPWMILLRAGVAAGFAVLAWVELKAGKR